MLELLRSLKKIIERKVVNIQTIRSNISKGDTIVNVKSAKRFDPCADIVIYREGEDEGEPNKIKTILNYRTLELENPVAENYNTSNARVQNMINGTNWVRAIYIGDPPVIPRYPAITIYGNSRSSEWLTIDSTSERYEVAISVYIEAAHYDTGYEYVLQLTKSIEDALFGTFYPLVAPYATTTLSEDVTPSDTIIRVEEDDLNRSFLWFFLENDKYTRHVSPSCYRENGVIELRFAPDVPFSAGDDVIFPGRHFYDTRPQSTDYGNVVKNSLLWGSRISYYAIQEAWRADPTFLPLNR